MRETLKTQAEDPGSEDIVFFGLPAVYVPEGAHIVHFFKGEEERSTVLAPFLKAGLEAGDQCLLVTEPSASPNLTDYAITDYLSELGMDLEAALAQEQLVVSEGCSQVEEMASMFASLISKAKRSGREQIRIAGDMTWALGKMASSEKLLEWEAFYDRYAGPQTRFVTLCQYDHTRFGGSAVMAALKTHRLAIIDDIVQENPFYQDPDVILYEVYRRRGSLVLPSCNGSDS